MSETTAIITGVDTSEVASRIRTDLAKLADRKTELLAELEEVEQDEESLTDQLLSIEAIVHRYEPDKIGTDPAFPTRMAKAVQTVVDRWLHLNRQEAVISALRDLGHPAHINEIEGLLKSKGRNDTYALVSAALSALRSKGIVEPAAERGVWKLAPPGTVAHGPDLVDQMTADYVARVGPRGVHFADNPPNSGMEPY